MRAKLLTAAIVLAASFGASAAYAATVGPVSQIEITVDPSVRDHGKVIGAGEEAYLKERLQRVVEQRIGGYDPAGGRLELTIKAADPNRPTMTEMAHRPGLSYFYSFSLGGAEVEGVYTAPDGSRTPVSYRWFQSDISQDQYVGTWYDADRAFQRFADSLVEDS